MLQTGSEGLHPCACLCLWIGYKASNSIVTVGLSDTFTAVVLGPFYRQHRLHMDKNRLAGTYTKQSHKYTHLQGTHGTTHSQAQSSHFLLAESFLSVQCCWFKSWDSFPSASSSLPRPSSAAEDCRWFFPSWQQHVTVMTLSINIITVTTFLWRCGLPLSPLVVGCNTFLYIFFFSMTTGSFWGQGRVLEPIPSVYHWVHPWISRHLTKHVGDWYLAQGCLGSGVNVSLLSWGDRNLLCPSRSPTHWVLYMYHFNS